MFAAWTELPTAFIRKLEGESTAISSAKATRQLQKQRQTEQLFHMEMHEHSNDSFPLEPASNLGEVGQAILYCVQGQSWVAAGKCTRL